MPIPTNSTTIYTPDSVEEVRTQMLKDYQNGIINAGLKEVSILPGSEPYIRFTALANLGLLVFLNIDLASANGNELTATGDALEDIRVALGLPEVLPAPSSGKLVVQVSNQYPSGITFADGLEAVLDTGVRVKVYGTQVGKANGSSVDVVAVDTGTATNAPEGTIAKWANPPVGSFAEATVGEGGLIGGTDAEGDAQKRARILQTRKYRPAAGNSGHLLTIAESNGSVQKAFVYPAVGGAGSVKVALASSETNRQVSAAVVADVLSAIQAEVPEAIEVVVQSVASEPVDLGLGIKLDYLNSFQNTGFLDSSPYPVPDTNGNAKIYSVTGTSLIINKTYGTPRVGSRVMWFNGSTFEKRTVTAYVSTGSDTQWQLTLDAAFSAAATDDYLCPSCVYADEYAATVKSEMLNLGAGENKANPGRAARIPKIAELFPASIGNKQLSEVIDAHEEIIDASWLYRSKTTATVPASVATAPNVLTLRKLGIYSI